MINENKAPSDATNWPIEILEAMDKLWEYGVRPGQYSFYWQQQADSQELEYDESDLED